MATLTAAQRKRLPNTVFAGAGRSYPVPDASHAVNAKARAKQQEDKGNLSPSAYKRVVAKANRVLGK